jgi:ribosomal protein S18 acetylase RimI-like enzyme
MAELEIRAYRDADEPGLLALWARVFPDPAPRNDPLLDARRRAALPDRALFLVALADDRVIGSAMGGYDGHRGWVYRLAVEPERRRQGIAAALMRRLEAELDARGCPKLNLQVMGSNTGVLAFYRALGYREEDRVSMGKVLPGAPGSVDEGD